MVATTFDNLTRLVRHVYDVTQCRDSERCILALLYDLQTTCPALKLSIRSSDGSSSRMLEEAKSAIYGGVVTPTTANHTWKPEFMSEVFDNPKRKVDPALLHHLRNRENALLRYNFVCCAVSRISNAPDNETLNDISHLCAEVTAMCNLLAADWLGEFIITSSG